MRVVWYQCSDWLRKIILLTLAASRGVTDQLVRKFKDSLGINVTMKKCFIFVPVQTIQKQIYSSEASFFFVPVQQYKHHVRSIARSGVCPQRHPHAQQQLARDLEVESAFMGQRCRPQSSGEVQRCNTLLYVVVLL